MAESATVDVVSYVLTDSSYNWWKDINRSPFWQDRIFHALAALYGIVAVIALRFPLELENLNLADAVE